MLLKLSFVFFVAHAYAQQGDQKDAPGTVQVETWKNFYVPPAPILSAEQALDSFKTQAGYSIELAAAEPLINDPVAITWDEDGRLFAAEMWSYMPNADGHGEREMRGRIVVLEDKNQDGKMDTSTVFLDHLMMPRAIAIVKGGVLIADPPTLWFCADKDNNRVCDKKIKAGDYALNGSVEHMENGLLLGMDNWLYNARSSRRMRWTGSELITEQTAWRGQWGVTQDNVGRIYSANNSVPLLADFYPYENSNRNRNYVSKIASAQDITANKSVFANRVNTGVNRGYKAHTLRKDGRLKHFTAASGPTIYRGDALPKNIHGNAFFTEPAANVVGQLRLHEKPIGLAAERVFYNDPQWEKLEFLSSTDERFRPVNMATGPDGYLYIVDMYRGILQHKEFLTTFLRKQIIERDLDKPVGLGRIYRIRHQSSTVSHRVPQMSKFSDKQLVDALSHSNGWQRDTAQRLLVQKDSLSNKTQKRLNKLIDSGQALASLHALWVLNAHKALSETTALTALNNSDAWVRIHAMRTAEQLLANPGPLQTRFLAMANDPVKAVRLQFLHSLHALNNPALIIANAKSIWRDDSDQAHFVHALISSLAGHEHAFILDAGRTHYTLASPLRRELLTQLMYILFKQGNVKNIFTTLDPARLNTIPLWQVDALWQGVKLAVNDTEIPAIAVAKPPVTLIDAYATYFNQDRKNISQAFYWPGMQSQKQGLKLTDVQQQSIQAGEALYASYCMGCHQPDGSGMANLAPPLRQSEWVNHSPARLALVISQGLSGKITVNGKPWDGVMPAHGNIDALQKQGLADLISFLRSAWGNQSGPVQYSELEEVMLKYKNNKEIWTQQRLKQIGF